MIRSTEPTVRRCTGAHRRLVVDSWRALVRVPVGAVRKLRVIGGVLPARPAGARLRLLEAATLRLVTEPVLLRRRIPVRLCARRTRACLGGRRLVETVGRAVDRVVPSRGRLVGVTAADLVRCADRSVGVFRTGLLEHRRSG